MSKINNLDIDILSIEKVFFNNLQSDFYKLFNILNNNKNVNNNILCKFIEINNIINNLQNKLNEIKIDILNNNLSNKDISSNNELSSNDVIFMENNRKDDIVIDFFKPYMIYYRLLLDIN